MRQVKTQAYTRCLLTSIRYTLTMNKRISRSSRHQQRRLKQMRARNARTLFPLLSILCFVIGLLMLIISSIVFRHGELIKWVKFSGCYLAASLLFLIIAFFFRDTTQQDNHRKYR